jgi:hypothetical protein
MADPIINLATPLDPNTALFDFTTLDPVNVLSNAADSGKYIRVDSWLLNSSDSANPAVVNAWIHNAAGTGMNSNTGRYQVAMGADVVAGTPIGIVCPNNMQILGAGGQFVIDARTPLYIHENQSLIVQVSAINDVASWLTWTVVG